MKYYLLTFNDDWADEHDVPALACMTEEEYQEWRERPSGKLNPKYEEQQKKHEEQEKAYDAFIRELKKRKLYNKRLDQYTDEEKIWYHQNKVDYVSYRSEPQRVYSGISASLGNGGDNFNESYNHLYLMKEFVEQGIVDVMEVSEDFYNTFKKANLSQLSLCNVFDNDIAMYIDDEDYDEDDEDYDDED